MTNVSPFPENDRVPLVIPPFPLDIFPERLQEIILTYCEILNLNIDYCAVSTIFSFSVAMGGHYRLTVKRGWKELPTLFIALVGKPGINKSAPISIFTKPLEDMDRTLFKQFLEQFKAFQKTREHKETKEADLPEPIRKQLVIKDTTQEALLYALYHNPHGFGGIYDELGAFLKSFNKYRSSGGDEEVMLSLFSGKNLSINRRSTAPIFIEHPFLSIIGSIQPKVLVNLLGNIKIDNGLTHRFLFTFPDNIKRMGLTNEDVAEFIESDYAAMIKAIIRDDFFIKEGLSPRILHISYEGFEIYKAFRQVIDETINNEKSDAISGIYAKLDTYCLRLSLILQVMYNACGKNRAANEISPLAMSNAVKLTRYFEQNALKVFQLMEKYRDPLADYPQEHKMIYYQLPAEFETGTAWEIARKAISRRTLFNLLNDQQLFIKVRHGYYKKIW